MPTPEIDFESDLDPSLCLPPVTPPDPNQQREDAVNHAAGLHHNGIKLQWTISRRSLWRTLRDADGASSTGTTTNRDLRDAILFIFLAINHHKLWCEPRPIPGTDLILPPLRSNHWSFLTYIDTWADEALIGTEPEALISLMNETMGTHQATAAKVTTEEEDTEPGEPPSPQS